jgi:O-antigen/teichoic acid export membrane protein
LSLLRRAASSIAWAQLAKIVETGLAFLLSVVVIRGLGPVAYGEYSLLLGIISLGVLFSSFGVAEILSKHVPRLLAENDPPGVRFLLRRVVAWRAALTLLVIIAFWVLTEVLAGLLHLPNLLVYRWPLVLLFLSQNLLAVAIALFNATLKMKQALIVQLTLWSASLGLTLLLFRTYGVSVTAVLYASILAVLLTLAVSLFLTRNWLVGQGSPSLPLGPVCRFGATVWLTSFATFGLDTQIDVLLMGYLLPDQSQIGFYRAAVMPVQRLMQLLFGAWSGLIMPVLSESHATHGTEGIRKAWSSYIKLTTIVSVPVLLLSAAVAEPALRLLYSDQFQSSAHLLQLYALLSVVGFSAGYGLSTLLLQTLGMEALALRLRLLAGGVNVLLDILLIPPWGAAGAIVGTCLAGILLWFAETIIVLRRYQLKYPWVFLAKVLLASLAAAALAWLLPLSGWPGLIASTAGFALLFVGLCSRLKPLSPEDHSTLAGLNPKLGRLANLF